MEGNCPYGGQVRTASVCKKLTSKSDHEMICFHFLEEAQASMGDKIEVTVTIGDKQVTLAGPESFVREEVQRLTNIIAASAPHAGTTSTGGPGVSPPAVEGLPATEREFVAVKSPNGHSETVAVLAYFLSKSGRTEFAPEDIKRAYARAGVRPPKVMPQALRDAKNLNDYLEAGTERGSFRLSAHGERTVVFDLPRKNQGG